MTTTTSSGRPERRRGQASGGRLEKPRRRPTPHGLAVLALAWSLLAPAAGSAVGLGRPVRLEALESPAPGQPAAAQTGEQSPQQGGPEQATVEPVAIPVTEIPERAAAVAATVRRISELIEIDPQVTAVEEALPELEATVTRDLTRLQALDVDTVILRTLDDMRQAWVGHRGALVTPEDTVTARYGELEAELRGLDEIAAVWQLTLASLDQPEDIAGPLRDTINRTLVSIADIRERLEARFNAVLRIQSRVATIDSRAEDAISDIDQLSARVRQRLFNRDSAPLWGSEARDVDAIVRQADEALDQRLATISGFLSSNSGPLAAHLFTFLLLAAAGFLLRRREADWEAIEGAEGLLHVLSRPFSGAAIFALLIGSWFYVALPTTIVDLFLIATLVPVLRLAPGLLSGGDRRTLYGLLALYAALRVVGLTPEGSMLRRLVLLMVSALALVGLVQFVRSRWRGPSRRDSGWWRFAGAMMALALPLLAISLVANVLGWTRLAWVITAATISSGYGAIIVWLFAVAGSALAAILPATGVGALLPSIRRHAAPFTRLAVISVRLTALFIWGRAALTWFQLRDPLVSRFRDFSEAPHIFGGLEVRFGSLLIALLILLLTPLISKLIRFIFLEEIQPRLAIPRGSATGVASLLHYLILATGAVLAAAAAGLNPTQLTVFAGALGVGIGFGMQNIVNNFISGLILLFERPITAGDRIAVGQQIGIVTRIGIRASTVRTFDGAEVVVPNGDLVSKEVTNWTLSDMKRRVEFPVFVAHGTDPHEMLDILKSAATTHPQVLDDPEPLALFDGYGESALSFRLLYWVPIDVILTAKSEVGLAVNDALREAGIRIPYPQRDVHLRSRDVHD